MKGGPALMIGIGPAPKGMGKGEPDGDEMGGEEPSMDSPGALAAEAFCKAKDRGDYEGVFDAFKAMLDVVDDEDDGMGDEMVPPEKMM